MQGVSSNWMTCCISWHITSSGSATHHAPPHFLAGGLATKSTPFLMEASSSPRIASKFSRSTPFMGGSGRNSGRGDKGEWQMGGNQGRGMAAGML